ncbi:MAG: hypothetical protein U0350_16680 [Caldilineaceae bacterium]
MAELPPELARLLDTAKSPEPSLPTRLRALAWLAQIINRTIVEATVHQPGHYQIQQPHWTQEWALTTADVTNTFCQISQIVHKQIIPLLAKHQIVLTPIESILLEQRRWLQEYFINRVYPLLTPLAVDPGHPFPYISSDSLNYLVLLQAPTSPGLERPPLLFARVKVPRHAVPRIVHLPTPTALHNGDSETHNLVWCADLVRYFVDILFPGMMVTGLYQFHVLRAAVTADPEPDQTHIRQQKAAPVVRLDIEERAPRWLVRWLVEHLDVAADSVVPCAMPLELASLSDLADHVAPLLSYPLGQSAE